jgi:hypothetical protein
MVAAATSQAMSVKGTDCTSIKDVVNAAFEKAIKSYERKHGTIDDDVKRDAKDLF